MFKKMRNSAALVFQVKQHIALNARAFREVKSVHFLILGNVIQENKEREKENVTN